MRNDVLRILLLSDETLPEKNLVPSLFENIDLIISCGDLPAWYLSYIAEISRKDVLYIPGNHDDSYLEHPPLGCISIDDQVYNWNGLTIMGLGGGHVYNFRPYQYTQYQMSMRYLKLRLRHFFHTPIDLLVTHSPAWQLHDGRDPAHTGFQIFRTIMERLKPLYFIHGHMHLNYGDYPRMYRFDDTTVVNAFTSFVLEIPWKQIREKNDLYLRYLSLKQKRLLRQA